MVISYAYSKAFKRRLLLSKRKKLFKELHTYVIDVQAKPAVCMYEHIRTYTIILVQTNYKFSNMYRAMFIEVSIFMFYSKD